MLHEKPIKIGAKVTSHGRYVTFQMAEVAVSWQMFADILALIAWLRAPLSNLSGGEEPLNRPARWSISVSRGLPDGLRIDQADSEFTKSHNISPVGHLVSSRVYNRKLCLFWRAASQW
jgi:hypothetical protein